MTFLHYLFSTFHLASRLKYEIIYTGILVKYLKQDLFLELPSQSAMDKIGAIQKLDVPHRLGSNSSDKVERSYSRMPVNH